MPMNLACPQCAARIEVPEEQTEPSLHCPQCMYTFPAAQGPPASERTIDRSTAASAEKDSEPRRPRVRTPLPYASLGILAFGILFILLLISMSFNGWILLGLGREQRNGRREQIRAMEQEVQQLRIIADQAKNEARQQQITAEHKYDALQRQNEELKRELEFLRQQPAKETEEGGK